MVNRYPDQEAYGGKSFFSPEKREEMIIKYAYLVKYIAYNVGLKLPAGIQADELISAGSLGLIDAVDKYDSRKDVSLKTYARYRIKGAILDDLRSRDWYSRSLRKKIQDIARAVTAVENRTSLPAEEISVAEEMGLPLAEYQKMLTEISGVALLDLDSLIRNEQSGETSGRTFSDQLKSSDSPYGNLAKSELKKVLAEAIRKLSEKEQLVVSLYYYEELTLKEIGKVLTLTESRICQIHTSAVLKLKNRLKSYFEE